MYRGGVAYRTFSYSRAIFALDFLLAFATIGLLRVIVRARPNRDSPGPGVNLIPTLIVGRGPEAALCIREMRARPELGYRVIGIVENGPRRCARRDVRRCADRRGSEVIATRRFATHYANEVIISDPNVPGEVICST